MRKIFAAALLLMVMMSPALAHAKRPAKPTHKNTPHTYTKHHAAKHPAASHPHHKS
jgi:hypothetical protein